MQCTIVSGPVLAVHSPYNRDFAARARMVGGYWHPSHSRYCARDCALPFKTWTFPGFSVETLSTICEDFYPGNVQVADAIPVPTPPAALPDFGYHGTIGAKVTVRVTVEKAFDYTSQYGSTRIHVMRGCPANLGEPYRDKIFVWFASAARFEVGDTFTLVGQVKAHNARDGVSQTVLTRCKKIGV